MSEAIVFLMDNSEWMRNGDYYPNRLITQSEAIRAISSSKSQENPENEIGLISMAGACPQVQSTFTTEVGRFGSTLSRIRPDGNLSLIKAVGMAQLMLKHRRDQRKIQRIIMFIGSPVNTTKDEIQTLGKILRKNRIICDLVWFGDDKEQFTLLSGVISTDEESCIVCAPASEYTSLESAVEESRLANASNQVEEMDPDLELAIKLSMAEQQDQMDTKTEDQELQEAIAMSLASNQNNEQGK